MKIALFDWNNTIINDLLIWFEAVKKTFRAFGKQPPTIKKYFRELTAEGDFLGIYASRGITASRDELNRIYEASYKANIQNISLFPNVKDTLKFLLQRRIIMGLITAQKEYLVSPLLDRLNLNNFFHYREFCILNKEATIRQIVKKERVNPNECCFIGDAPSDMLHGKKAGVKTIAFLNGYIPKDLVLEAEPDFAINNFKEIREIT